MTEVTYEGLTHTCDDPECHVPGFVLTLRYNAGEATECGVTPWVAPAVENACQHPYWTEEGDGHGHNHWRCTECGVTSWIAPWVVRPPEGVQP